MTELREFRITYRRADWLPTTDNRRRHFATRERADAFVARLAQPYTRSDGRIVAAAIVVRIDCRDVGPWGPP